MDKWNAQIAKLYVNMVKERNDYNVMQCEKMSYALTVILSEMEKLLALLIIAVFLDATSVFLLSVMVVISLRITMGGMHRKTFWGCFFFSLCFFLSVIEFTRNISVEWNLINVALYLGCLVIVIFRAPLLSTTHPNLIKRRRKKLKIYSFCVVTWWMLIAIILPDQSAWKNCIEWTILLHILEIYILEGGRVFWKKRNLLRK